jgi:hypothetical protein
MTKITSKHKKFDVNNDGVLSGEEMDNAEKLIRLDNEDKKQDAQRRMAWVSIISMVLYPILCIVAPEARVATLESISDILFLSQAGIVAAFFGTQAWMSYKKGRIE